MNSQRGRGGIRGIGRSLTVLVLLVWVGMGQCPTGTTGFNCVECPTGCDTCATSATLCDECSRGYYISSSLCVACPTNCLHCSTPTTCIDCTPGYDGTINASGHQECTFYWWKWFLIIFGTLLGVFLIGLLIWWIKQKLNEEDNQNKEIEYQMKPETTEGDIEPEH